jgi:hypothetical protein
MDRDSKYVGCGEDGKDREAKDDNQWSGRVLIKMAWGIRPSSRWRTFRHVGSVSTAKFPSIREPSHQIGLMLTTNRVIGLSRPRFRLLVPGEALVSNGQPPGKVGSSSKVAVSC